jgi:hypothetical protein
MELAQPCRRRLFQINASAGSENESKRGGRAMIIGDTHQYLTCLPIRRSYGMVSIYNSTKEMQQRWNLRE